MGIPENIVMASDVYEVEELPQQRDLERTIQKSFLTLEKGLNGMITDKKIIRDLPLNNK